MAQDSYQDIALWNAFQAGDKSAYAEIYELYFDSLYSYGKQFAADPEQVEDAIQELFIRLWRTRERLSPVDNIKFYLFLSLRRDIHRINEKEKAVEKIDLESILVTHDHPADENGLEDAERELTQKLASVLNNLSKRQLEAITLRYYENFSIAEIASVMDVSEKTVRNTLHNSLTLLRKNSNLFYSLLTLTLIHSLS